MKINKALSILIILALSISIFSCDMDGDNGNTSNDISSPYQLKILSSGGGFFGYYIVNGGVIHEFTGQYDATESNFATYETGLNNPRFMEYYVEGYDENTKTISAKIYVNNMRVHDYTSVASEYQPLIRIESYHDFTLK